jgi:hypothetical protein
MRKIGLIGVVLGALVAAAPAQSAVIFLDSVTAVGSNFRYDYSVEFARNEGIKNGSTFAIFDFQGYVPGSVTSSFPNDVTASTEFTSALPLASNFSDDAKTTNLRFTYNGDTQTLSRQSFGKFSALSRFGTVGSDGFSAVTISTGAGTSGLPVFAQGLVGTPVGSAVPEPASWALMISGFGLIGGAMRRQGRIMKAARIA